jgi:hypothetical protein
MNEVQGNGSGPGYRQPPPPPGGFERFTKHIILGAVFSGVVSGIPLLGSLNCLFCILNIAGIALALTMYLKEHPGDCLTSADAAIFGAAAGGGAGLIAGILMLGLNRVLFKLFIPLFSSMPHGMGRQLLMNSSMGGVFGIPVKIVLFAAFGALGAWLAMLLFFKDRLRQ